MDPVTPVSTGAPVRGTRKRKAKVVRQDSPEASVRNKDISHVAPVARVTRSTKSVQQVDPVTPVSTGTSVRGTRKTKAKVVRQDSPEALVRNKDILTSVRTCNITTRSQRASLSGLSCTDDLPLL